MSVINLDTSRIRKTEYGEIFTTNDCCIKGIHFYHLINKPHPKAFFCDDTVDSEHHSDSFFKTNLSRQPVNTAAKRDRTHQRLW